MMYYNFALGFRTSKIFDFEPCSNLQFIFSGMDIIDVAIMEIAIHLRRSTS